MSNGKELKTFFTATVIPVIIFAMSVLSTGCSTSSGNSGDDVPVNLVGDWYSKANQTRRAFAITQDGKGAIGEQAANYDVTTSDNTVTFKISSESIGSFNYTISNGEMAVTNGTGGFSTLPAISPFVKIGGTTSSLTPPQNVTVQQVSDANPVNNENFFYLSISWDAVEGAEWYKVQYENKSIGGIGWTTDNSIHSTNHRLILQKADYSAGNIIAVSVLTGAGSYNTNDYEYSSYSNPVNIALN